MTTPPVRLRDSLQRELPPQQAFAYDREAWIRWTGDLPNVERTIKVLPVAIDRAIVAGITEDRISQGEVVPAFVVAMMWGHGKSNYGPSRTAKVLAGAESAGTAAGALGAEVIEKLAESVRLARCDGLVEGYRYLNNAGHLKGLGPAFFTKWLYFATARGHARSQQAAPVLDALVIRWFKREADLRLRYGKTSDYERYLELLTAWGKPHGLSPVEVEERIFRLIRSDGERREPLSPGRT
ncbi:hypothetical protein [Rudaeicoccus suwonensis]|uniref:Uncharacterized protein n=1 Tax=Rudaeicoccus suwonensis TaxID=657409 RepID=A0A561E3X2_9MICO|nr:hypothetical protein [Rudaeicoccus suwonensis]TWE10280.1 hypothetical protein BKA23_2635 [Rudaeicoccus suwonensis]